MDHAGTMTKNLMSRRRLLQGAGALAGLAASGAVESALRAFPGIVKKGDRPRKMIYVAIDALHPAYAYLDSRGSAGGSPGNWLVPNIRAFLDRSLWYTNAMAHLPAATDMNHLNALAGTSSAQTGIIGVWAQPASWDGDEAVLKRSHLSFARDDRGRPVDTIFHAWKRRWPDSKTMLISGKEWVAEMFRDGGAPAVDLLVTGKDHPAYLKPPRREGFADPFGDSDAACDPESGRMGFFDFKHMRRGSIRKHMSPSNVMTRLYTGQRSLLTVQMEGFPERFPHDSWVADSALELFRRHDPDLAYILLAQCDDGGHCIGTAHDPSEFVPGDPDIVGNRCAGKPAYNRVSARNRMIVREAALDCIRDVDRQFGRLMRGLEEQGIAGDARVILLSDHSAINHLSTEEFLDTDVMGILRSRGIDTRGVYAFSVSSYGVVYWRGRKKEIAKARAALLAHRAKNPQTGAVECPWWVLDRKDMREGVPGVSLPGELYHAYYIDADRERNMLWPDLVVLARNGWQIPVYNGHIPNVGINVPKWAPPWRVYNGGHGSVDTLPIMAAISVPGGRRAVNGRAVRISDLGATALSLAGLRTKSTMTGRDLTSDLR
ncbi:MAG TPA: alkaline phosphatase family protein [Spirochaetota bacterium]|nr:alkaline phosphatase family protein [Spirochaetota bacterium]HRT76990.1 alkaline phosphatase family protein [Spirochaetota bacterium]